MADKRDKDSQNAESLKRESAVSSEDLKQQGKELLKATGEIAGLMGKLAIKKGIQLKNKLEDEEFQEKARVNVKAAALTASKFAEKAASKVSEALNDTDDHPSSSKQSKQNLDRLNTGSMPERKEQDTFNPAPEITIQNTASNDRTNKFDAKNYRKQPDERKTKTAKTKTSGKQNNNTWMIGIAILLAMGVFFMWLSGHGGDSHDGQINAPLSSSETIGLYYEDVVKEFQDAGFTNVKSIETEDVDAGLTDGEGIVVKATISGEKDFNTSIWYEPGVEVIVYYHNFEAETPEEELTEIPDENSDIETSWDTDVDNAEEGSEEMAFRAAVVALTNSLADDVFDSSGNAHDPSKYHSYADQSGDCILEVISRGNWSIIGENKWHVESLKLENSFGVVTTASMDVEYDGELYIISNVSGTSVKPGLEEYGINDLGWYIDPSHTPNNTALEVPESLIEQDR